MDMRLCCCDAPARSLRYKKCLFGQVVLAGPFVIERLARLEFKPGREATDLRVAASRRQPMSRSGHHESHAGASAMSKPCRSPRRKLHGLELESFPWQIGIDVVVMW
jgi:hypothetical protein